MEKESPRKQSRLAEIPGHIQDFIKTKIAYYKLIAIDGGASALSAIILGVTLFFFGLFFLVFLSIAGAIGIGYLIDNMALGFLIVAAFYLLLMVLLFTMRKTLITNPITSVLINTLANDADSDEQE